MTYKASVALRVKGALSLDGFDELVELIRETAYPHPSGRTILVEWEAESLWDLRGDVEHTLAGVSADFFGYVALPDTNEAINDPNNTALNVLTYWEELS